jgi:peptide deformylase
MLSIRYYGDPILRKTAQPIEVFDDELRLFVDDMVVAMKHYDGVGLAAPQVGNSVRCVVVDVTGGAEEPLVLINPEYMFLSENTAQHEEGCLSFPDLDLKVTRPARVSVKAYDASGREFKIENAEDLLSRALQHEIDHLNGIMIIDHVSLLKRKMLKRKLKTISELDSSETESDIPPEDKL